jgi:galactose-1-phosphate uridylyltransferase
MDYIWTPWRYQYMKEATSGKLVECIFCDAAARKDDAETLVVYRGAKTFVILNRYPYTSGHVMVVPYAHVAELSACDAATLSEMMELSKRVESAFRDNYNPDAMVWRFEFHDGDRRDAGASRGVKVDIRAAAEGAGIVAPSVTGRRQPALGRHASPAVSDNLSS